MVFENPNVGLEKQLAPFHEFECTGYDDEYVQEIDRTEEVLEELAKFEAKGVDNPLQETLDWYGYDEPVDNEQYVEREGSHKFGFAIVKDGRIVKAVQRTNPNKKWDWWVVGGRWGGFLKLKDSGDWVNSATKGEIDWEGMRDKAGNEAGAKWDRVREIAPNLWEQWDSVIARFGTDNLEQARKFYNTQSGRTALHREFSFENDDCLMAREAYVERARNRAVASFAVLKDGQWMEKGRMGWFAAVSDPMPEEEWQAQVWEIIQSAPDETFIHVVDCHI